MFAYDAKAVVAVATIPRCSGSCFVGNHSCINPPVFLQTFSPSHTSCRTAQSTSVQRYMNKNIASTIVLRALDLSFVRKRREGAEVTNDPHWAKWPNASGLQPVPSPSGTTSFVLPYCASSDQRGASCAPPLSAVAGASAHAYC